MKNEAPTAREIRTMAGHRDPRFAPLRVVAFTATAFAACASVVFLGGGCGDGQVEATRLLDAAPPPPPGACAVTRTTAKLCDADASSDASSDAASSDASAPDGAGTPLAPPESENRCLVTEDITIACPSSVSAIEAVEGKGNVTDVVLAQIGLARFASPTNAALAADENAHLQHIRIDANGEGKVVLDPLPPYDAADTLPEGSFALLPSSATHESRLFSFAKKSESAVDLRSGPLGSAPVTLGAPFTVAASISSRPRAFASSTGEGFFVGSPRGGAPYYPPSGPLVLVRGLPDAPRAVTTAVDAQYWFATTDPSGSPVLLYHDGTTLHLREGEDFGAERWSTEVPMSASGFLYDVGWVKRAGADVPVVLYVDRNGAGVRYAQSIEYAGLTKLGESFSTCPRSSYLGVTCDACPVDKSCEIGSDAVGHARMFRRGDRLFVVFLATDTRRRMGYARSVVPIVEVGCACTLEERSKTAFADSLVVVEIVPHDDRPSPEIVERMRIPLYKANTTGHVGFHPRSDGDVDVIVGGPLGRYDQTLAKLPEKPVEYRLLRLSTSLVP